ncbi:MAG TPA: protein kinase [Pyrinomonadaceae bacterium]|jgi:serine/threonine protein kinase
MTEAAERAELIKKLFNDALDLEPDEREKFLLQVCGGDAGLQNEIESLLNSDNRLEDFLQAPAADFSASEMAAQLLVSEEAAVIGKRVGVYRIEREIGRGGMGAVYLARRDDGQFQKNAAIKLLRRETENASVVSRFHKERQILADLEHPNIARLLDGGTTESGLPYFVMEYIEGLPLNRFCEERNLSINERLKLFRQICAAVEFAHEHSVIHRDLKPSNILVTKDGEPKLLDFGIAKTSGQNTTAASTKTALRVMTPEYASPEQMRGERVTKATDIYSLGVLLYELVTGNRPYNFDGKSPYEIVQAICADEPLPPSAVNAGCGLRIAESKNSTRSAYEKITRQDNKKSNPQSRDLDKIILKALRKEPERRYQSVREFSEDVSRLLKGLPVSARQDTIFYRGAKFFRLHQTAVLSSLAVAFAFFLIGFFLNMFSNQSITAELPAIKVSEDNYQDLPIERKKGGTDNVEARNLYLKAQFLWNQRTLMSLKQAAELFHRTTEKDPEFALAYSGLSNSYFLLSVWGGVPAKEIFPLAKAASLKATEIAPEAAEGHLSLAMVHWLYEYDWQAADREFKTAIELNPAYGRAPHWYGLFLAEMGRFDEAVATEKRALALEPQSIPVKADLARVLFYARRYDESLAQYREIIVNPNFGAIYPELLQLYEAVGMTNEWAVLMERGGGFDNPDVRKAYETGGMMGYWRKQIEMHQNSDISDWHNYYNLGTLYAQIDDREQAFELLNKAIDERDHRMAQIKVHPKLDNLRSDPRFIELLQRMNFDN